MPNIWGMYAELKATYHATYAENERLRAEVARLEKSLNAMVAWFEESRARIDQAIEEHATPRGKEKT